MGYQGAKEERRVKNRAAQVKYLADPEKRAAHYARVAERNKRLRQEIRDIIVAAKSRPCTDCGVSYPPCVMDFDHVRGEKVFGLGAASRATSKQAVLDEIAKCEVVCANCHRLRTQERASTRGIQVG